ncbi:twin-arginine translocase TatA/TatE family subunit [Nosocomiicoccus sp. HMSC09A07]|uniref:twin-arginine translocase TatA/TatE family subunit n=1 Tax=Nosocomiicoccus sp. HMSC09A07 TaxID=1581145 RepID=UPI0008A243A3|nr:hypothetical protein HMPREF3177_07190 [Nosocomiicoccus sp. HMSC09A07]
MSVLLLPMTIGAVAPVSLIIIAAVALLIFGPTKLPQLGRSVGTTVKEFKEGFNGLGEDEKPEEKKEEVVKIQTKQEDETIQR